MYDELIKRLHSYSENYVAYKLDADFADAVKQAADAIEALEIKNALYLRKQLSPIGCHYQSRRKEK